MTKCGRMLKDDLEELIDIAVKDALIKIKNGEDKLFLQKQREDVFLCSYIDLKTKEKETRKRQWVEKNRKAKERYKGKR